MTEEKFSGFTLTEQKFDLERFYKITENKTVLKLNEVKLDRVSTLNKD